MANSFKPVPKSQKEISKNQIEKTATGQKPISSDNTKRELQRSVKNDTTKRIHIGLRDIDETIVYYFNNVIKPTVMQNGSLKNVPVLYGSPERWKSVQKDGFYRDKNGKIQAPLIMFKRDTVEKNRGLGNKVDPNNPLTYGVFKKKFSRKLSVNLWGSDKDPYLKRNYKPGHHGASLRTRMSDYGIQLRAKQRMKFYPPTLKLFSSKFIKCLMRPSN